ncbi:MAG: GvpL/GvpF family gas vesicle protein, partial [Acidobacteria bacterium]|nr:GvpL/GvpF family gas vesicle protein [Acidobacteriota bacterium]
VTVFHTKNSLSTHVVRRFGELKNDLLRIRGADQWGVKVFEIPPMGAALPKVRSRRMFYRKGPSRAKMALFPARCRKSHDLGAIERLERSLRDVATEVAPSAIVSCGERGLSFQTTLLVRRSRRKKLESVLENFARQWVAERRIECTGPWPPYSFVSRPKYGSSFEASLRQKRSASMK